MSFSFRYKGSCQICEADVEFVASGPYFRSTLRCNKCKSVPRERALLAVLTKFKPNWRDLAIHEGSPSQWLPLSIKLRTECPKYVGTQYDTAIPFGAESGVGAGKYRSENLERQTFDNAVFDVVVTQDVFEHVFHPEQALREIERTLRPNGISVFTVPLVQGPRPSQRRANLSANGEVTHLLPAQYHGGSRAAEPQSLVTIDWGWDIVTYIPRHSGLSAMLLEIDDIDRGIQAELNHVVVCHKATLANLS